MEILGNTNFSSVVSWPHQLGQAVLLAAEAHGREEGETILQSMHRTVQVMIN